MDDAAPIGRPGANRSTAQGIAAKLTFDRGGIRPRAATLPATLRISALNHRRTGTMNYGQSRVGIPLLGVFVLAGAVLADPPSPDPPKVKPSNERKLVLPETPDHYADLDVPAHFKTPAARRLDNTPRDNPVTDAGATLGRVLFYDTRLSVGNNLACASCHQQKHAFTDPNRFSKGHEGKLTDRHAPNLIDLRHYQRGRFFWDERAGSLEDQVLRPIQSKLELGHELARLMDILAKDKHYPGLYKKVFGTTAITSERTARALAQFLRALVSYRSKYDEGLAKARVVRLDFANFTTEENRGKTLFLDRCASCHLPGGQTAHFVMDRPRNNGLDREVRKSDGGIGDLSLNAGQVGLFKSPSLRNVELTGPYMHDGRFKTLEEVVEHYSTGIKQHPNLDGRLRGGLNFDQRQKAALVAFLRTLTDEHFIADPKYSDPFQ
jgi:cytochrome c peroxidase